MRRRVRSRCAGCGRRWSSPFSPSGPVSDDTPFGVEMTLAAILLGVFMPLIALIAALVMRSGEVRPSRRQFLKTWAIASGAWLCTGWILALLAFAAAASSMPGGPP